jgi:hypothetical protein
MQSSAMLKAVFRSMASNSSIVGAVRGRAADRLSASIVAPTRQPVRSLTIEPSSRVARTQTRPSQLVDSLIDLPFDSMGSSGSKCVGGSGVTSGPAQAHSSPPHLTGCRSIASMQPKSSLCCSCVDSNQNHLHSSFSVAVNPLLAAGHHSCSCQSGIALNHPHQHSHHPHQHHLPANHFPHSNAAANRYAPLWTHVTGSDSCCDQLSPASPHQHSAFCVYSGQGHTTAHASVSIKRSVEFV